ncbi:MAG: S8 family serine peptidase [Planctomycetota bacterium]|jgi:subtilisin family serine protease
MKSRRCSFQILTFWAVLAGFSTLTVPSAWADTVVCFTLDEDPGWTTEGEWTFGVPSGGGSFCHDPNSGHTGANVYGYNLDGDYADLIITPLSLTTTPLNCSGYENVKLSFWRWLGVENAMFDHASVEVSNNGEDWTVVWAHTGSSICDGTWVYCVYDISAVADGQPVVFIRWAMGPTDGSVEYPGWNIDDICLLSDIIDDLDIVPLDGFSPSGYEGGPFAPSHKVYTLTNEGAAPLPWTASAAQPWLDVVPPSGQLDPNDSNTMEVFLTAGANDLLPGAHHATIEFKNINTGVVQTRDVTLNVLAYPAEVQVTDSIPPATDQNMPFGDLFVGLSRTEKITITNVDPSHGLLVTNISLRGRSASTVETPELSTKLPRVVGGTADSRSYVPADWAPLGRPGSRMVVPAGYRALTYNIDVLLLASGDSPMTLRTGLLAFPDINSVDYFDCASAVPTVADLARYEVVVVMSNQAFDDAAQTGDVLADYVDAGGKVVQSMASFAIGGGWELAGRFATQEGYEPFGHGDAEFFLHSLGDFDPGHLIMEGVTTLTDEMPAGVSLRPGAQWVADWQNGVPLVATQGSSVVGINMFVFDIGEFGGDVPLLFHNAVVWLFEGPAEGFELTDLPELPVAIAPLDHLDVNVVFKPVETEISSGRVIIESHDEDEPRVVVQLSGTGVPDYLGIVPQEDISFWGHPGGPFVPSKASYKLTNGSMTETISWSVAKTQLWFDVEPSGGTLPPGDSMAVIVGLNSVAESLPQGDYQDTLVFTDITTGVEHLRGVTLAVSTAPKIWIDPAEGGLNVTVRQGRKTAETLTIGNSGDADLHFNVSGRQTGFVPSSDDESSDSLSVEKNEVAVSAPPGHDFTVPANARFAPGQLLVRFAPRSKGRWPDIAEKNAMLANLGGGTVEREYNLVPGLCLVSLPLGVMAEQALIALNNTPGILYAEPNYEVKLVSACQNIPADPRFNELWALHNTGQAGGSPDADIDAPEAWCIRTEANNVIVAVVDTGVDYTHPDLKENMWVNEAEFYGDSGIDDDENGYVDDIYGYDFVNDDGDPMDDNFHGTHVAGTIGAVANNGEGIAGVCWNVRIMALKFLNAQGTGYTNDAISCMQYSIRMGAILLSNSWGGGGYEQALKDAIDAAGEAGQLFVAAAGNDGLDNDTYTHYPSSYGCDNIIAVLSTDRNDYKSGFSNYGAVSVDLGAPGSDILSCVPGGGYRFSGGTSMATPHVAGACALIWSALPSLAYTDVKEIILETVDPLPDLAGLCVSGGRLNVYNAILEIPLWFHFVPETGVIAPGHANNVVVSFDAAGLAVGEYYGEILISSNDYYTPVLSVPVKMTVEPDVLQVLPTNPFESTGFAGGPFEPESMTYTLNNVGNELLEWTAISSASWLDVDPNNGILDPGGFSTVVVSINADADVFDPNTYEATVTFTNVTHDVEHGRDVTLRVTPPDYLTELFDLQDNDLANRTLTFVPDGSESFYSVCSKPATAFPTDSDGGTVVSLNDDDYSEVILSPDAAVSFYGQNYNSFYIGSNGYITFETGDTAYFESLESHFQFKRISALFDDLSPDVAGRVSWKQLSDRIAVTFENVPEYRLYNLNSFQVEMLFDGILRITLLEVDAKDGLVGLSNGYGLPPYFTETDLSGLDLLSDLDSDCDVDFVDYAVLGSFWGAVDCNDQNDWCQGADSEPDGDVDWGDLKGFVQDWLRGTSM